MQHTTDTPAGDAPGDSNTALPSAGLLPATIRCIRSEWIRLRQSWKLPVAAIALAALATVLTVTAGGDFGPGGTDGDAAGGDAAAAQSLEAADGIVAGVEVASTFVALIALVLWALSVSRDLQTGSIRVLLVTEARRTAYLGGKLLALTAVTVTMAVAATAFSALLAYPSAAASGIETHLWSWDHVWSAMVNLALASVLWGSIGAFLAVASRSASGPSPAGSAT